MYNTYTSETLLDIQSYSEYPDMINRDNRIIATLMKTVGKTRFQYVRNKDIREMEMANSCILYYFTSYFISIND